MTEHDSENMTDAPDFRAWADDPANAEAADELIAHFVAEEGVELVGDLVAARGSQHQWVAERWVEKLADQFRSWWAQGQPRLGSTPKVSVSHWATPQEDEARKLLAASLPPGATFFVARAWRKAIGGAAEPKAWVCRIEDGAARAMGQGAAPAVAAKGALEAWREYVTASRFDVVEEAPVAEGRPPLLDAPSGHPDAGLAEGREAM